MSNITPEATDVAAGTGASTKPTPQPWYRRRLPFACAAGALVIAGAAIAIPLTASASSGSSTSSAVAVPSAVEDSTTAEEVPSFDDQRALPGSGGPGSQQGGTSGSTTTEATAADAEESVGVVIIETVLGYQEAEAAGTGMVLTSDGLILTNNHVIDDSTEITVTIASTGETYTATLVGADAENDVALLQIDDASGLETVTLDTDAESIGDAVTAVGNADGGGVLMAADGEITDLESTVTTSSPATTEGESLDGMIEIVADVVSGDSGGALLDSDGEVIGMTTAASVGSATTVAYAVPIEDALSIVEQILAGDESGTVTIGAPAFLGVQIAEQATAGPGYGRGPSSDQQSTESSGAEIGGVIDGTPAADAGLEAGDVITAVDGTSVTDGDALSTLVAGYDPGDTVTITWTDTAGETHTADVTLMVGPA
ncbi:S1C family serine protease [Microbacterium sp. bgisy189]|uniref:S1C family serine protease n=1 Tax=Microbacterium sp. bgisy189 TaxID=3413798 RepID=UPI003EBFEA1A